MPKKKKVKDWGTLRKEYEAMWAMSCVPAYLQKLRTGTIIDEEKSVRWNREEVERNNEDYLAEVQRLNQEKNKIRDTIHEDIYKTIQSEFDDGLSKEQARALWEFAYAEGHPYGWDEIMFWLRKVEELAMVLRGNKV